MKWWVTGGVYTDFNFVKVRDPIEVHGPFDSYNDAVDVWRARMWLNVDNALHRMSVIQTDQDIDWVKQHGQ